MRSSFSTVECRLKSKLFSGCLALAKSLRSIVGPVTLGFVPVVLVSLASLASVALCACGGASFPTVTELPKVQRKPDGVVLERPLTVPDAEERGKTEASLLALREPFEARQIVELVKTYFRAWEHEDVDGLTQLLTADAVMLRRPGTSIVDTFRTRIRTYEYQRIAGMEVARFDRLERFGFGDVGASQRPPEMREGDLLVRVPVLVSRVAGDPLFGEGLVLLVRREEGAVRIAGLAEDASAN